MSPLNFDSLRSWDGSQARAFEELTYQLLRGDAPAGTRAIRTANPDGGVEWYAKLADGAEHGWQAKHVHDFDNLLNAMTESVRRVCLERPQLTKLTFVVSMDLTTGTAGNTRRSQRQRYESKIATWREDITGAADLVFELFGKSDLLDRLAQPEHSGRVLFWWDQTVLGPSWLRGNYEEQADAAGDKYRPDLQVDIPIQDDLLSLGFDHVIFERFDELRRQVLSRLEDIRIGGRAIPTLEFAYATIATETTALQAELASVSPDIRLLGTQLESLRAQCRRWSAAVSAAAAVEYELRDAWNKIPKDDPERGDEPPRQAQDYNVRYAVNDLDELEAWLDSSAGKAWVHRAYFLTGQAGSGKTHLLLDATRRALDAGRPACFLSGAAFQPGGLWASIADQLGLGSIGRDDLLRAMETAAEAASLEGARFLILIDAINETGIDNFWHDQLPQLRSALRPYPHLALAVSCRDTYVPLVLAASETGNFLRRSHPGFAGSEVEATQKYFRHYGLEAPQIPLLVPEFTVPLFLRLYCESLVGTEAVQPSGHEGRVTIFERYLFAKLRTISRRAWPGQRSAYELERSEATVRAAIDRIVDAIADSDREGTSFQRAEEVVADLLPPGTTSARFLGILQDEGILTRERLYLRPGETTDGVRIVFQAFSDFLILVRRLARTEPADAEFIQWVRDECSPGIQEAATILLPEHYGVELVDLLASTLDVDEPAGQHSSERLHEYLVESLPYREASAITERTIDLLNEAQRFMRRRDFYRALFLLAPIPNSPLNGQRLFEYLRRFTMPKRDVDFGEATYHELDDSSSPATRLARWAAAGPYPDYAPEVIELAATPLIWLMSSPNRFMRDWVTKALVQLMRGHLDVMERVLRLFWQVNDPYVVQRVVVIAYGAYLRAGPNPGDPGLGLATAIRDLVFARPIRPDELLLDAARGIIRHAVYLGQLSEAEAQPAQRPHGLKIPGAPPSEEALTARYGWRDGQPDSESYSTLCSSVLSSGLGDFGRYVVESGVHNFSRYRIGAAYPERVRGTRRLVKKRWTAFVATLTDEQIKLVQPAVDDDMNSRAWIDLRASLTPEQAELESNLYVRTKLRDDDYPSGFARRWVLRRAIGLRWTPDLFGEIDRRLSYRASGREAHKAERWGKKYQWMAYHELLARVADNYQANRLWFDEQVYDGLQQIIADREIDPTQPPVPYDDFSERRSIKGGLWTPAPVALRHWPPVRLDFDRYRGSLDALLDDVATEPTLTGMVFIDDDVNGSSSDPWVVLKAHSLQTDPRSPKAWRGPQQYLSVDTLLVRNGESAQVLEAMASAGRNDVAFFRGSGEHTDCCYVAEIGGSGPRCSGRADGPISRELGDSSIEVIPTTEEYTWESGLYDCSVEDSVRLLLPSTFLQAQAHLVFDDRGPSWLDPRGNIVVLNHAVGDRSSGLLVRSSFLKRFMSEQGLELVLKTWFERRTIDGDFPTQNVRPWVEAWIEGSLNADFNVTSSQQRRIRGPDQDRE